MTFKRIPKRIAMSFLSLCVIVGYQNCGKGFQSATSINILSTVGCAGVPASNKSLGLQQDFQIRKVDASSLEGNYYANQNQTLKTATKALSLKKGSEFDVRVKANCAPQSLKLSEDISADDLEAYAQSDICIDHIAKKWPVKTLSGAVTPPTNDPLYPNQNHLFAIQHPETYAFYFGATGISQNTTIALIDSTGVDVDHEDLQAHKWINYLEAANGINGIDDDSNGYIDDINGYNFITHSGDVRPTAAHGTYVAGFAAAVGNNSLGVSGVMARDSKIMPLEVSDTASTALAFRYAADNGAQVISISLAIAQSDDVEAAIRYAISKGVTIFAAAGNNGATDHSVAYPAAYSQSIDGMIAVGSVDANPASLGTRCAESSYDNSYVMSAPGCDTSRTDLSLLSTYGDPAHVNHTSYNYNHGTSFASPMAAAAGAMALSFARDNYGCTMSPAQVETIVREGSFSYTSLNSYFESGKTLNLDSLKSRIQFYFQ